jgi:hypothetical protein
MPDFSDSYSAIERSRVFLKEFRDSERDFRRDCRFEIVMRHSGNGHMTISAELRGEFKSTTYGEIVGNVCTQLMAALDRPFTQSTNIESSQRKRKRIGFPISDHVDHWDKVAEKKCNGVPKALIEHARAFRPWKGGNEIIWAIKEISNFNKHVSIWPLVIEPLGVTFRNLEISSGLEVIPAPRWDPENKAIDLFYVSDDAQLSVSKIEIMGCVGFGNGVVFPGRAVEPILVNMIDEVERLVSGFPAGWT